MIIKEVPVASEAEARKILINARKRHWSAREDPNVVGCYVFEVEYRPERQVVVIRYSDGYDPNK